MSQLAKRNAQDLYILQSAHLVRQNMWDVASMLSSRSGKNGNESCGQQRHQQQLSHGEKKKKEVRLPPGSYTIDMQFPVTLMHELHSVDQYVR